MAEILSKDFLESIKNSFKLIQLYPISITNSSSFKAILGLRPANTSEEMKKGIKEKIVNYLNDKNILDIDIQFLTNVYDEVDLLFAERVRDYVNADGGQLSIAEIKENEGLVVVSLKGACSLCPHSMYTMSAGIESILKRFLPWVKDVKPLEKPVEPNFGFKLASKEEIRKKLMAKMKGSQV